jgi:UDP:flavonoid glycosyltransferase YjiC (YdhE family)
VSRVLIAATGGTGHITPLLPFAEAFARRGDDVLLIGPPSLAKTVRDNGYQVRTGEAPDAGETAAIQDRMTKVPRAEASVLMEQEFFGRLSTTAMLPAMTETCREWRPDLILREPCEYSSAVVADRAGIRHAQVAISFAEIETDALELAAPVLPDGLADRIRAVPFLTRFPASLDPSPFPVTRRFHEPPAEAGAPLPDWWNGDDRPLVYLTLGTMAGQLAVGAPAYRAALDAVAELPVRVLLTVGRTFDAATLGDVPANTHVAAWVPQADVLREAALVCCHGGSGTTFGTLAAGVPLVILPMFADQPANGRRLAAAGAGLMVEPLGGTDDAMGRFGPADAPRIRAAIESVLSGNSFRTAAKRVADDMFGTPTVAELAATMTSNAAGDQDR